MTAIAPQETLALLDSERAALVATVSSIPEANRARRPADDRWSVSEVLEHLLAVEKSVGKLVAMRGHEAPATGGESVPLDDRLAARLRDRGARLEAPERIHPRGTLDAMQALAALEEARAATKAAFLAADPTSLDGCTHPHIYFGSLTLRDWVNFLAHHEARHRAQIAEIGRALG